MHKSGVFTYKITKIECELHARHHSKSSAGITALKISPGLGEEGGLGPTARKGQGRDQTCALSHEAGPSPTRKAGTGAGGPGLSSLRAALLLGAGPSHGPCWWLSAMPGLESSGKDPSPGTAPFHNSRTSPSESLRESECSRGGHLLGPDT